MTINNTSRVCSAVLDLFVYWQISGEITEESLFDHSVQHCGTGTLFKQSDGSIASSKLSFWVLIFKTDYYICTFKLTVILVHVLQSHEL